MIRALLHADGPAPRHPLLRALALVAGGLVFVFAAMLGAMVFLAILGLTAVAGVILALRTWWLRRRLRATYRRGDAEWLNVGRVIEGEFRTLDPDGRRRG